jgi:uncharacterized integral membrane protein
MHFGLRLYGKVHQTASGRYVATEFVHIMFMPIAPNQSYIVMDSTGSRMRGVKIPLDPVSITVAYLRWSPIASLVVLPILVFAIAGEGSSQQLLPPWMWKWFPLLGGWFLLCLVGALWSLLDPRITKATAAREAWMEQKLDEALSPLRSSAAPPPARNPILPL